MEHSNLSPVLLDTNIIVSALLFGGKPRTVFHLVLRKEIDAVISRQLIAELLGVLAEKFHFPQKILVLLERKILKRFRIVLPLTRIDLLKNPDDRVLEAALEGRCAYIVTGDKELLALQSFQGIVIVTAEQFLRIMKGARMIG